MKDHKLSTMLALSITVASVSLYANRVDATNTLPDAKAGECYAKVIVPAKFETKTEKILVTEPSVKISITPAKYGWKEEKVLVKEASKKLTPIPAVYKSVEEKVLVKPAQKGWFTSLKAYVPVSPELLDAAKAKGVDIDNTPAGVCYKEYFKPAVYKNEKEKYVAKEASDTIKIVPAEYKWVEKKILVKEASKKIVPVPATYSYIEEKILVEPEKSVWKKGSGLVEKVDNTTGEIMCLVKVPAVYKTVKKRVVKTPATTKVVEIPAVYKTIKVKKLVKDAEVIKSTTPESYKSITKVVKVKDPEFEWHKVGQKVAGLKYSGNQICLVATPAKYKTIVKRVVKTPASVKEEIIPAVYKTIKVKAIISDAKVNKTEIPAKYKTITKREKTSDERLEWRRVLCQTNMDKLTIQKIQRALKKAGFYQDGPIDGIVGSATLRAIDGFQIDQGLPRGGITYKTLQALGVEL